MTISTSNPAATSTSTQADARAGHTSRKLSNGLTVTTYTPPADFDLAKATDDELRQIGLPPRPAGGAERDHHDRVRAELAATFHYIPATVSVNAELSHRPRPAATRSLPAAGVETFYNWSGAVVYPPSGSKFSSVQGDWNVPDVDAPTEHQWYYSASWVGIDGDQSGDVCQAGIATNAYRVGTSVSRTIYPWFEWFPAGEVEISNFPVSFGDFVTLVICAGQPGSTKATAMFSNRTNGATTSVTLTAPSGTSLQGNCAEWIVEAPTVSGEQSAMADYGQVVFTSASASAATTVGGGSGNSVVMIDQNDKQVSVGTLLAADVVQCAYVGTLP